MNSSGTKAGEEGMVPLLAEELLPDREPMKIAS